ncbi:hypothetical protein B5C26_00980 [Photorhabdus luminescens]|uniref:hypothetical protein n=1 Tax=Photorhabdus luminescens TaxID=29488 RepID=UPI000B4C9077|nr:hypothetical protein [Photorhabdus luminescens]OWO86552.1 hypothetical protein B5C26_00980 [Photorhabdus luminescens]
MFNEKFDRQLQRDIISAAVSCYPNPTRNAIYDYPNTVFEAPDDKLVANIVYLNEQGLIKGGVEHVMSDPIPALSTIIATKDGIDFILDDGGLSAILNVVTIKVHDETIQQIAKFIEQFDQSPEDKKKYLDQLKQLPYETTKHIVFELVKKGLTHTPDALQWLGTMLPPG